MQAAIKANEEVDEGKYLINFCKIVDYVGSELELYDKGDKVFALGLILMCSISSSVDDDITNVFSLCLQSSDLYELPYDIKVVIKNSQKTVIDCKCSCSAFGLYGKCEHCVAVLIYLTRNPISTLESLSDMDLKQWDDFKKNSVKEYKVINPDDSKIYSFPMDDSSSFTDAKKEN